jgi:acyl carrier protein
MRSKKKPRDRRDEIIPILIEELDIEDEALLTPSARIADLHDDPDDALAFITARLENELELEIPDGAEMKLVTVQDIYNLVAKVSQ